MGTPILILSSDAAFQAATIRTSPSGGSNEKTYSIKTNLVFINFSSIGDINLILAQVDLSAYAGETVTPGSARFGANVTENIGPDLTVTYHEVLRPWFGGTAWGSPEFGAVDGVHSVHNTVNWTTLGARGDGTDRNGIPDGSVLMTDTDADFHFPVSDSLAQQFIDGPNNGVLFAPQEVIGKGQFFFNTMYYYFEIGPAAATGRRYRMLGRND